MTDRTIIYTTAPATFDYSYVRVLKDDCGHFRGNPNRVYRKVSIPNDHLQCQCGSYSSSMNPSLREIEYREQVSYGDIVVSRKLSEGERAQIRELADRLFELHDARKARKGSQPPFRYSDTKDTLASLAETIGSYLLCVAEDCEFLEETLAGLTGNLKSQLS